MRVGVGVMRQGHLRSMVHLGMDSVTVTWAEEKSGSSFVRHNGTDGAKEATPMPMFSLQEGTDADADSDADEMVH